VLQSKVSQNDYKFEPVHPDWSGLRTQMTVGLLCIFSLCLINFIPFCQDNFFSLAPNGIIDFTLYFVSCSVVALITLEIGRSSGNRNGAGSTIWSALIFAISPWQSILSLPTFRVSRAISLLILLTILIWFRGKKKVDKVFAFIGVMVAVLCGWHFETQHVNLLNPLKQLVIAEYGVIGLIVCARILLGSLSWRATLTITLCLLNAVICSEITTYPSLIVIIGSGLAISLTVAALPVTGAASARSNQIFGWVGMLALTSIAITYEFLFIGY
jgi:hypothetical protein